MQDDDAGYTLQGRCLYGDGHHFCSYNRAGAAFSNARGEAGGGRDSTDLSLSDSNLCYGSQSDTIYWAWDNDEHFCSATVIGTGCLRRTRNAARGPGLPMNPYNYLMVW